MRSLLLAGLLLPLLAGPLPADDLFGLGTSWLASGVGGRGLPGPAAPLATDELSQAERLVQRAWKRYWGSISSQIGRVECGYKATSDRGDDVCKYTLVPAESFGTTDAGVFQEREELLRSAEQDLSDAGSLLAGMVGSALDGPPPEATDAGITRTGRLVAALKAYNDLVDRGTRTQLVRHKQLWRDQRVTVFADPLPRFDVQGLVAHVDPAAFAGGTPGAGRGDLEALVDELRGDLEALAPLGQAYREARIPVRYSEHRAASGVSREDLVRASAGFEAAITRMAPAVARIRYELEARGLAEESRGPWRVIGSWEMVVNGNHGDWVNWSRLPGFTPLRDGVQVVWHMFPPLFDAADQGQAEKISDRWMPFGADPGSAVSLGQTRPTLPNS